MKQPTMLLLLFLSISLLTGCLYPDERLAKNQVPYKNQIQSVQTAVDDFKSDTQGLLPIKTKESATPIYQKYPIDFNKLTPRYIEGPPGNSFESGGIFQYVLTNVEKDPTVKLIDLRSVEPIRELKLRIRMYRDEHGYPPFKEQLAKGIYTLDYKKLRFKSPPYVESPYSGKNLSLLIDGQGEIYIDYRPDLYEALQTFEYTYETGDDIRDLLVDNYLFVPIFSTAYTVEDGEPVFLTE